MLQRQPAVPSVQLAHLLPHLGEPKRCHGPSVRRAMPSKLRPKAHSKINTASSWNTAIAVTTWDTKGFQGLEAAQRAIPAPKGNEVLVQWTLRPVNPADISLIQGRMGRPPLPLIPGAEGLGVVRGFGSEPGFFKDGQRVVALPSKAWSALDGEGTWQVFSCVPADNLVAVPDWMADEVAAQCTVNPLTAYGMLSRLTVPDGSCIIQSASGSVLGRHIASLARHRGIKTINLVRRPQQVEELTNLGADAVFCTEREEDVAGLLQYTKEQGGAYAGLDAVGGRIAGLVMQCVRPGGQVLLYGALSGPSLQLRALDIFLEKQLQPFTLRQWLNSLGPQRDAVVAEVLGYMKQGIMQPVAGRRFKLQDAAEAAAESIRVGRASGKVLLEG